MAWTDVANQLLGAQAPAVINALKRVDPNFDWSRPISEYAPAHFSAADLDPSRGSPSSIAAQISQWAGNQPYGYANQARLFSVLPQNGQPGILESAQTSEQNAVQAEQATHGGKGLFGDLGPLAQIAALIPGPQQPFILAANAANAASQGNWISAGLNAFGAYGGGWDGLSSAFNGAGNAGAMDISGGLDGLAANAGGGAAAPWWQQPMAGGVSDTGFGAGRIPGVMGGDVASSMNISSVDGGGNMGDWIDSWADSWSGAGDAANGGTLDMYGNPVQQGFTVGADGQITQGIDWSNPALNGAGDVAGMGGTGSPFYGGNWWDKIPGGVQAAAKMLGVSPMSLLGAAGGALLGSKNGQKQAGTTTTTTDVPEWLKPYYLDLLSKGAAQTNQPPADYSQSDAVLKNAMGMTNPYLNQQNPYFENTLNLALNDTQGRVNNQFRNSAFGGSANQELLSRNLGDQSNSMRFGQYKNAQDLYGQEMNRATNVAGSMPQYQAQKVTANAQPLLNQKSLLSMGGSQTSTPYYTNPTGSALYGGLLGSQLFGGK